MFLLLTGFFLFTEKKSPGSRGWWKKKKRNVGLCRFEVCGWPLLLGTNRHSKFEAYFAAYLRHSRLAEVYTRRVLTSRMSRDGETRFKPRLMGLMGLCTSAALPTPWTFLQPVLTDRKARKNFYDDYLISLRALTLRVLIQHPLAHGMHNCCGLGVTAGTGQKRVGKFMSFHP